jgi:hypothetical protein
LHGGEQAKPWRSGGVDRLLKSRRRVPGVDRTGPASGSVTPFHSSLDGF